MTRCPAGRAVLRRGRRTSLLLALAAGAAAAQGAPAVTSSTVDGRVVRGSPTGERPVAGLRVILHRIGSDSAGPVDSMRTSANGQYRFRYQSGDDSAMYIVSTRFAGVAYFTSPLAKGNVSGAEATIVVYDTTSRPFPIVVRGRHLVISRPAAGGLRRVVDVFEIANDSGFTRVAGDSPRGTWSIRLPAGVETPSVGQGDISPDAMRFTNGEAILFAPVSPGLKQVVLTYELPPGINPVTVPVDATTGVLEVLLEDPSATASGGSLVRQPMVSLEGRSFERFIGQDVPAEAALQLSMPGTAGGVAGALSGTAGRVALVALAGAVLALGVVVGRRRLVPVAAAPAPVRTAPPAVTDPQGVDGLANAIAALDAVFESQQAPSDAARRVYERRRAELKARLVARLAADANAR